MLGIQSPDLFRILESRADWLFDNGNVQEISNCVWAMSEHGPLPERIIHLVNQKSEWLLSYDNYVAVNMVARSLAKHNVKSSRLFARLKDKLHNSHP